MKLETFFEKFDLFADAPDAVAKMRELVLQLAVQGKLVPQDPNDEPGAGLLNRLIKFKLDNPLAGRSGRSKEGVVEFEKNSEGLPANWVYTTIGEVLYVIRGASPRPKGDPKYFSVTRTPYHWVKISDIRKHGQDGLLMDTDEFLTEAGMHKSVLLPKGTLVLTNSATIGVPIVLGIEGCCIHDGYLAFPNFPQELLNQKFLLYLFHTMKKHAERNARGLAQLNLNTDLVRSFPFGLPPLAEQKRIVAKVDELMGLCDRLEARQQEREEKHSALSRAALARFADAPTPANLQFLFHPSYTIAPADLRKSILTLAVQGKLVPQDPNDEPAEELLARIERERAGIAKEQGVRPPKNVPPFTADNCPHDIPESWQWSRIGHLALVIDYGTSQKADSDYSKVPVYRMGNIVGGRLVDENLKYVDSSIDDLPGLYLKTDDILFNRTNSYDLVGKAGIYTGPDDTATFASYLIRIRLPETLLFPPFYSLAMNAPYYRQTQIEPEVVQQCGQANFNGTKLASTVVPLPPLAEQKRIVAKVDELMKLVDALETQLAAARTTAANLLAALVAELTGTPNDGNNSPSSR